MFEKIKIEEKVAEKTVVVRVPGMEWTQCARFKSLRAVTAVRVESRSQGSREDVSKDARRSA